MYDILNAHLGYVACNVCGDGNNTLRVSLDPDRTDGRYYVVNFTSTCYQPFRSGALTRDEAVATVTRYWRSHAATRAAHRRLRNFVKDLTSGKFERRLPAARPASPARPEFVLLPDTPAMDLVHVERTESGLTFTLSPSAYNSLVTSTTMETTPF